MHRNKQHHYSIIEGESKKLRRLRRFLIFIPSDEDCDDRRAD
jgi:hypothetical protein